MSGVNVLLDVATLQCEDGWNYYEGNCYRRSAYDLDQARARYRCHNRDAELVSFDDDNEMNFVASLL